MFVQPIFCPTGRQNLGRGGAKKGRRRIPSQVRPMSKMCNGQNRLKFCPETVFLPCGEAEVGIKRHFLCISLERLPPPLRRWLNREIRIPHPRL